MTFKQSSKQSKKQSPFVGDRTTDILTWSTKQKPGTEYVFRPESRQSDVPPDSHPFCYRHIKKLDPALAKSRDIITFKGNDRFYSGELHFETPIKKLAPPDISFDMVRKMPGLKVNSRSFLSNDVITFSKPEIQDRDCHMHEVNYRTRLHKKDPDYHHRDPIIWTDEQADGEINEAPWQAKNLSVSNDGRQVGALLGVQRHIDAMEKTIRKSKPSSLIQTNTETHYKEPIFRSLPPTYQTWYDIQIRAQIDEPDKYSTTF